MEKLNVAIADDNEKMVEVLGQIIEEDKDLELVGNWTDWQLSRNLPMTKVSNRSHHIS